MLAFGNKEFRNLQEQVLKNMDDIKSIKEGSYVLDEFGIKVIGQVATEDDLPGGQDFEYGDAFAVGTETPYELWIWTRTDEQGLIGYWLDIGAFPVPGPQGETGATGATGPQGPQGEKGDKGDKGDTGEQGPQGAQGEKGDTGATGAQGPKGDTGTTYTILGQVDEESDLPNPSLVDRHGAYLVGTVEPYELYVVSGDSNNLEWLDAGVIAIGPQGPQGPAGPKGDTGATGAQGPQGETGAQGPKGDTGDPVTITVNGTTYTQSGGNITLPNYPNGGVWGNITGTLSNQTDLKNALDAKQDVISDLATIRTGAGKGNTAVQPADLATVATTGDYDDLIDKPTIPSATSQLTNDSGFITNAALSGYALSSEIPTAVSELTNDSNYATETYVDNAIAGIGDVFTIKGSVATVADLPATGNAIGDVYYVASEQAGYVWIEINNVPQWEELGPSIDLSGYAETADLATVAFSGSYNDLSNKPTIPAAQVNADWNAASGVAQILNKPTIPTNYLTTDSAQTITGAAQKTWTREYQVSNLTIDSSLKIGNSPSSYLEIYNSLQATENDQLTEQFSSQLNPMGLSCGNGLTHSFTTYKQGQIQNGGTLTLPTTTGTLALASQIPDRIVQYAGTTQTQGSVALDLINVNKVVVGYNIIDSDSQNRFRIDLTDRDDAAQHWMVLKDGWSERHSGDTYNADQITYIRQQKTASWGDYDEYYLELPVGSLSAANPKVLATTDQLANMVTTNTGQNINNTKYFAYTLGSNNEITNILDTGSYASNTGAASQTLNLSYTDGNSDTISTKIVNINRPVRSQYYIDLSWSKEFSSGNFLQNDIMIDSTGISLSKYSYDAANDTEVEDKVTFDDLKTTVDTVSSQTTETWTFTVDNGQGGTTTVTKTVVLG